MKYCSLFFSPRNDNLDINGHTLSNLYQTYVDNNNNNNNNNNDNNNVN